MGGEHVGATCGDGMWEHHGVSACGAARGAKQLTCSELCYSFPPSLLCSQSMDRGQEIKSSGMRGPEDLATAYEGPKAAYCCRKKCVDMQEDVQARKAGCCL
eukprot:380636-Pelagomonas_calceolata.AAC.12